MVEAWSEGLFLFWCVKGKGEKNVISLLVDFVIHTNRNYNSFVDVNISLECLVIQPYQCGKWESGSFVARLATLDTCRHHTPLSCSTKVITTVTNNIIVH